MVSEKVVVLNETGLHARPAAIFVQNASRFKSDVTVTKEGKKASAKSILAVLSLGILKNTEITISAEGIDEEAAVRALTELIQSEFAEK